MGFLVEERRDGGVQTRILEFFSPKLLRMPFLFYWDFLFTFLVGFVFRSYGFRLFFFWIYGG